MEHGHQLLFSCLTITQVQACRIAPIAPVSTLVGVSVLGQKHRSRAFFKWGSTSFSGLTCVFDHHAGGRTQGVPPAYPAFQVGAHH